MRRVVRALNEAKVLYTIIDGNAMQYWVAQADESVVGNTRDLDIIVNESDPPAAIEALSQLGFIYRRAASVSKFMDGPDAKARDTVHLIFAGKKMREEYPEPVPGIDEYSLIEDARTLPLDKLVEMKLTSFRDKDRVHIRDMISINLTDESWLSKHDDPIRSRLKELLDDPDG
jgi:hypothetical protein